MFDKSTGHLSTVSPLISLPATAASFSHIERARTSRTPRQRSISRYQLQKGKYEMGTKSHLISYLKKWYISFMLVVFVSAKITLFVVFVYYKKTISSINICFASFDRVTGPRTYRNHFRFFMELSLDKRNAQNLKTSSSSSPMKLFIYAFYEQSGKW